MVLYISNAFSLSMITDFLTKNKIDYCNLNINEINIGTVKNLIKNKQIISAIGHQGTADFLTKLLKTEIKMNRININLTPCDELIVLQLLTRLPEGAVLTEEEMQKIKFVFYLVRLQT